MAKGKEQAERRYLKAVEVIFGPQEPNCSLAIRGSGQFEIWFQTWGWFCFAVVPLTWPFLLLFQFLCAYCSPTKPVLSNLDKIQLLVDFFFSIQKLSPDEI